jgi:UDP-N-acetylmuramyl pentapeptide phosphotransferase/UDP-N-acetylglucosamine-1-phosphate transferase
VKLFGVSAAGLVAGALLKERAVDRVLAVVVIVGTAHLVNLVDVRPGRAAAAVVALAAPGLLRKGPAASLAAAAIGAAAAVFPDDLGERVMIGDTGAHALGAPWARPSSRAAGEPGCSRTLPPLSSRPCTGTR